VELGRLATACAQAWRGGADPGADPLTDAKNALAAMMTGTTTMGITLVSLELALCQEGAGSLEAAIETAHFGLAMGKATSEHMFDVELTAVIARSSGDDESAWRDLFDSASRADERGAHGSADRARCLHDTWVKRRH
jgi:hypothetical protein